MKPLLHKFLILIGLCLAALAAACTSSDSFTITGTVEGNPNMNIYATYYDGTKLVSPVARVSEGKFQINGASRVYTLVQLSDNEGRPLGFVLIKNGNEVSVKVDRRSPFLMQASGTDVMGEWSELSVSLADSLASATDSAVNSIVEKQVSAKPASLASALLFATAYVKSIEPARADSVAESLDPEVRISALFDPYITLQARFAGKDYAAPIDSLPYRVVDDRTTRYFTPKGHRRSLLAFCTNSQNVYEYRRDSLVPALKEIAKAKDVQVIDYYLSSDTANFRTTVRRDSANFTQAWAPGSIFARGLDRLALPAEPFYIVTDSAGRQLYRGGSLSAAKSAL